MKMLINTLNEIQDEETFKEIKGKRINQNKRIKTKRGDKNPNNSKIPEEVNYQTFPKF